MIRDFPLADVVSVIAGQKLSPTGMRGILEVLNHMTGEKTYPHQIARVMGECGPVLSRRFPVLDTDYTIVTADTIEEFVAELTKLHGGETVAVAPLATDEHHSLDPVAELLGKVPSEPRPHTEAQPAKKRRR